MRPGVTELQGSLCWLAARAGAGKEEVRVSQGPPPTLRPPLLPLQVDSVTGGSPLSIQFYLAAPQGACYGADHDLGRLHPGAMASIRAQSPIPNLYLTGMLKAPSCQENWDPGPVSQSSVSVALVAEDPGPGLKASLWPWLRGQSPHCPAWRWGGGMLTGLHCCLPGQDVLTCGLTGALQGALLCSSAILKRNLYLDLWKLGSRIQARKKKN